MARIPEILERAGKPFLTAAILFVPGCAPKAEPLPIVREVIATATAIPCDPEKYAESIGIPTPVPVGDSAAPEEMVLISRKVWACEPLSDAERDAFIKFGIAHPLLATPDPAKQLIPTRIPEPTLIPEPELSFPDFGVYYGKTAEGLEVLLAAKPDGKLVFTARYDNITCSNPNIKPINILSAFPRKLSGFSFQTRNLSKMISGDLTSQDTVVGQVGNAAYKAVSDKGDINCPATKFQYNARLIGVGSDAFVNRYLKMWNETLSPRVKQTLDSYLH